MTEAPTKRMPPQLVQASRNRQLPNNKISNADLYTEATSSGLRILRID